MSIFKECSEIEWSNKYMEKEQRERERVITGECQILEAKRKIIAPIYWTFMAQTLFYLILTKYLWGRYYYLHFLHEENKLANLKITEPEVNLPGFFLIQKNLKKWTMGNNPVPAKMAASGSSGPQHPFAALPSENYGILAPPVEIRYTPELDAVHLASEGFILLEQAATIICAVCPALRDMFLEVPFATSKSDAPAPWLASTYGKPESLIPHTGYWWTTTTRLVLYHTVFNILIAIFRDSGDNRHCSAKAYSVLSKQPVALLWCTCCIHLEKSQHATSVVAQSCVTRC